MGELILLAALSCVPTGLGDGSMHCVELDPPVIKSESLRRMEAERMRTDDYDQQLRQIQNDLYRLKYVEDDD